MIVMFRGGGTASTMAPQALAFYAAVNSVIYNRKTLVLQFMKDTPVEKILHGKEDSEQELAHGGHNFEDTGIDSLIRRTDIGRFEKENFDLACRHLLKSENLLDVAGVSRKEDFEREVLMKEENIAKILKESKKVYDDVYILGNGENGAQMTMLNKLVDLVMICVSQGSKEEIIEAESVRLDGNINEILYMVTEYDNRSVFDSARMKKIYDVKKIAILPYNTGFKDAYNSQTVLSFVLSNTNVKEHDTNYGLFNMVMDVQRVMMGQDAPEEDAIDLTRLNRIELPAEDVEADSEGEPEFLKLNAENVRYTKSYSKGLFSTKEVNDYEVSIDRFADEYDEGFDGGFEDDDEELEELEEDDNDDYGFGAPDGEEEDFELEEMPDDDEIYVDDDDLDEETGFPRNASGGLPSPDGFFDDNDDDWGDEPEGFDGYYEEEGIEDGIEELAEALENRKKKKKGIPVAKPARPIKKKTRR